MRSTRLASWSTGPRWSDRSVLRAAWVCTSDTRSTRGGTVWRLTYAMNVSLDGYTAAPGNDFVCSTLSDEQFQW